MNLKYAKLILLADISRNFDWMIEKVLLFDLFYLAIRAVGTTSCRVRLLIINPYGPSLDPAPSGSLVHHAALFYILHL